MGGKKRKRIKAYNQKVMLAPKEIKLDHTHLIENIRLDMEKERTAFDAAWTAKPVKILTKVNWLKKQKQLNETERKCNKP